MTILEVNFTICPAEKRAASSLLHSVGRERPHPADVDSAARLLRDARLQKQQVHQHRLSARHHHRRVHRGRVHVVVLLAPGQLST